MDYLQKYGYAPVASEIAARIRTISAGIGVLATPEILKRCFSLMDLTTLKTDDTAESVSRLVDKVTRLRQDYPDYPLPASVCVYPNFASVVRERRCSPELHVTTVAGCFPSSQSFPEVKEQECVLAVRGGADEVDIVLALNSFLAEDYDAAAKEIAGMRRAIDAEAARLGRKVVLKVILETGLLGTPERIARASFLAMEAGADFIKTSTGKVEVNATPEAAFVMCACIKAYYEKTGVRVGFKAAGGISTAEDALLYYGIGAEVLGAEWVEREHFRFGVSRLGNSLMSAIEQKSVKFF